MIDNWWIFQFLQQNQCNRPQSNEFPSSKNTPRPRKLSKIQSLIRVSLKPLLQHPSKISTLIITELGFRQYIKHHGLTPNKKISIFLINTLINRFLNFRHSRTISTLKKSKKCTHINTNTCDTLPLFVTVFP
jgi:hypothetical protein